MNKPTDFSIPTLDAATLQAPVNDLLQERGYEDVAEFLNQVATRGASFDFGAPVRIRDGDWREVKTNTRIYLAFGPNAETDWIVIEPNYDEKGGDWDFTVNYLGARTTGRRDGMGNAIEAALEYCREELRRYFEPLVTKGSE